MPGSNYKTRLNWKQPAPIPKSSSTNRPPSLHGYDFKDINRWLDKIDNYLKLCRIPSARPTTLAELVTNLAGPAEDLCYSIPSNKKETYANLRDSLGERFANDNQSWVIWQVVSRRQQRAMKTLDTYLTDLTKPVCYRCERRGPIQYYWTYNQSNEGFPKEKQVFSSICRTFSL